MSGASRAAAAQLVIYSLTPVMFVQSFRSSTKLVNGGTVGAGSAMTVFWAYRIAAMDLQIHISICVPAQRKVGRHILFFFWIDSGWGIVVVEYLSASENV